VLIALAGLPGSGKSTLAVALARRIGAVHLRIDSIERAIAASSLRVDRAEDAGYLAAYAVAADNLRVGRTVVADCVNPLDITRTAWRAVAAETGCEAVEIEVICSDEVEHRRRVEQRAADFPGEGCPDWRAVQDREYEGWARDRIVVDTAHLTTEEAVESLARRVKIQSRLAKPVPIL